MVRAIGERFEYNGRTLEVVEVKNNYCTRCYFRNKKCYYSELGSIIGACSTDEREKPVIFMEVKS